MAFKLRRHDIPVELALPLPTDVVVELFRRLLEEADPEALTNLRAMGAQIAKRPQELVE